MTYDFSPDGFPKIFSGIVANASMALPSLLRDDDGAFLLGMNAKTMEAFWTEYVAAFPVEIQHDLLQAIDTGDVEKALAWYEAYANFPEDEASRELATAILDELGAALPGLIRDEYASFRSADPLAV